MLEIEEDVYEKMLQVYQRTKKSMAEDVNAVKEWMKTQPHLPEVLDDKKIENFLLLNKCSIEGAKQKIDNYYTIRSLMPNLFENFNPTHPNFIKSTEDVYCVLLPKLTKEHYRVIMYKCRNTQTPHDVNFLAQRALHLQEIRLSEDHMFGDVVIADVKGGTLAHALKYTPTILAQLYNIYKEVFSMRIKAVYVVNAFPALDFLIQLIQKMVKPKIFQRIHVYSDDKILREVFDREILPMDYGGNEKSLAELQDITNKKLKKMQNYFDELVSLKVDESMRPQKLKNDEFLGYYGNFKELNFD